MGLRPPDGVLLTCLSPPASTAKTVTSSLAAFTAMSQRSFSVSTTPPWLPSPFPVPVPPVANAPALVRVPSAARSKTSTTVPSGALVAVKTAPADPSAAAKELLTDVRPRHSRKKAARIVHVIVARSPFDSKRGRPLATAPCYGVEQARRAESSRVGSERGESLDDLESARSVSGGRPWLAGGEP